MRNVNLLFFVFQEKLTKKIVVVTARNIQIKPSGSPKLNKTFKVNEDPQVWARKGQLRSFLSAVVNI